MGKQNLVLTIILSIAIVATDGKDVAVKSLLENINLAKGKVTELQLYVQDILSSQTPTNLAVASASSTATSPTSFGLVAVLDDPIRTAPDPNADIVGQAKGIIAFTSLEDTSIHMTFDLVFTGGDYNGSTLNVVGHNAYLTARRELSVVGGSGVFQLARGVVGVRTVFLNSTTGDAFFQYNITILHF